jgi:hypothetical protein
MARQRRLHLEDLFVRPEPAEGIAKALRPPAAVASSAGATVSSGTSSTEPTRHRLLRSMGPMLNQWRIMRIDGEALKTLASSGQARTLV